MRLWSRFVISGLVLALVASLAVSPALAASKMSKKKESKKEAKKEEAKKEVRHHSSGSKSVISGANLNGRPGYVLGDVAASPEKGQVMGAAHAQFNSLGSVFMVPFGVAFGVTDKLQLHASSSLTTISGASGLTGLTFGAKYAFKHVSTGLDIAPGLDFNIGPLNIPNASTFNFNPYGIVTYTTPDGLQLNGQLGIMVISGRTITVGPFSFDVPGTSFVQLNLGAAYPLSSELTGMLELGVNGQGSGYTPLVASIRTGHDVQLQAFGGFDFGPTVGAILGGGIVLVSK